KEEGLQIFINLPVAKRVKNILDDYQPWNYPQRFMEAFHIIKKRIHTPVAKQIESDLQHGDYANATELLLKYYYDTRYEHAINHYSDDKKLTIDAMDLDKAYEKVLYIIDDFTALKN